MNRTKSFLALAALTLTTALQATNINYEVKVAGYGGAGWIKVKPELRTVLGGKVAYRPLDGGWVTDRVARGESLRISITPSTRAERRCRGALIGVIANNDLVSIQPVGLPVTGTWNVTRNLLGVRGKGHGPEARACAL
jgi:hypothetical protein